MTDQEIWGGLAIQMLLWLICIIGGAMMTMPNGDGVIVGHIVGVVCALFGFPARFFWKD